MAAKGIVCEIKGWVLRWAGSGFAPRPPATARRRDSGGSAVKKSRGTGISSTTAKCSF
jgi:hypothetical protein